MRAQELAEALVDIKNQLENTEEPGNEEQITASIGMLEQMIKIVGQLPYGTPSKDDASE